MPDAMNGQIVYSYRPKPGAEQDVYKRQPKERELGLFFGNAILSKCAEMWVFGDRISEGMEDVYKRQL